MAQDVPIGKTQVSLAQLNERSREIFRQIVESYLSTGEPLGSRNLSRLISTPLSPASVRNVMTDLEQLGLIYSPHTSAGRLPTELGLRFFVDALMQIGDLNENDRRAIEAQVAGAGRSVESVLTEASGLLSGLTRTAGVVLAAKSNVRLKHIEFVRLEPERALVVLVSDDGQVENRIVTLPVGLPSSALVEATNFLNARVRGKTLAEAKVELERAMKEEQEKLDELTQKIVEAGLASWSGGETDQRRLIVRGPVAPARRSQGAGGSRTCPAAVRGPGNPPRRGRPARPRRAGRGRAHLHRLGEQAVLAVRFLDGDLALSRRAGLDRRRARCDRPDAAQLRPRHPDGRLHRQGGRQADLRLRQPSIRLDFWRISPDMRGTMSDTTQPTPDDAIQPDDQAAPAAAPKPSTSLDRELADTKDRLLRTLAEMENLRKRTEREVADARMYGISAFARDVLTVADSMHLALEALGHGAARKVRQPASRRCSTASRSLSARCSTRSKSTA